MPLGRFNVYKTNNLPPSPFPMRGLERFMQRRGMYFPAMPQRETFQEPTSPGEFGNLSNTLDVQAPSPKSGGIKAFFSKFSRKSK